MTRLGILTTKDIYGHSSNVKKSSAFATISDIAGGQSLLTLIDKSVHRVRRKSISRSFAPDNMVAFEPIMIEHIQTFCDGLLSGRPDACAPWTGPRNMRDWCKSTVRLENQC